MDWGQIIAIISVNIVLISWIRSNMKSFEAKIDGWKQEIYEEMKDFHGRLCALEEKTKGCKADLHED